MRKNTHKKTGGALGTVMTAVLFLLVLALLVLGTGNLAQSAGHEGEVALQRAIGQAAVYCYATEGFYPPGLSYITEHYGVQIDYEQYSVRYEVVAANVMPSVRVAAR